MNKEEIKKGLREALRFPEGMDIISPDMDSRTSLERAVDFVENLLFSQRENIVKKLEGIKKEINQNLITATDLRKYIASLKEEKIKSQLDKTMI